MNSLNDTTIHQIVQLARDHIAAGASNRSPVESYTTAGHVIDVNGAPFQVASQTIPQSDGPALHNILLGDTGESISVDQIPELIRLLLTAACQSTSHPKGPLKAGVYKARTFRPAAIPVDEYLRRRAAATMPPVDIDTLVSNRPGCN